MAFFGLTQMGYQDSIREHVQAPAHTPQSIYRSGLYRDPPGYDRLPRIEQKDNNSRQASPIPIDQVSGYGSGANGSHKEYVRLKEKHMKNPREGGPPLPGVTEEYRFPLTTSQEIAQWQRDEPLRKREPWAHVKRHILVNSEMTKFVKDMSLTNREFSLY